MWGTSANPDIANATTVPHLTIKGSGDDATDFYTFTITDSMIAQATSDSQLPIVGVFDIDHGYEGFGTYWGAQVRLYELVNEDGSLVANLIPGAQSPNPPAALAPARSW